MPSIINQTYRFSTYALWVEILKNLFFVLLGFLNGGIYGWMHFKKFNSLDAVFFPSASMVCAGMGLLFLVSLIVKICTLEKDLMGDLSVDKETMLLAFPLALMFLIMQIVKEYVSLS